MTPEELQRILDAQQSKRDGSYVGYMIALIVAMTIVYLVRS